MLFLLSALLAKCVLCVIRLQLVSVLCLFVVFACDRMRTSPYSHPPTYSPPTIQPHATHNPPDAHVTTDKYNISANTNCLEHEYACSNGDCIPREAVCDDHADCADADDEIECSCALNEVSVAAIYCEHRHQCDCDQHWFCFAFFMFYFLLTSIQCHMCLALWWWCWCWWWYWWWVWHAYLVLCVPVLCLVNIVQVHQGWRLHWGVQRVRRL